MTCEFDEFMYKIVYMKAWYYFSKVMVLVKSVLLLFNKHRMMRREILKTFH